MVFSYPQFLLSGISQISLSKAEFLPETFANLIVAIFFSLQMFLYLFCCCWLFFHFSSSLHAFSPSLAHSQFTHAAKHTRLIRPLSRNMRTRAAGLLAPPTRGRGLRPAWGGVSLEEMNLAPQR